GGGSRWVAEATGAVRVLFFIVPFAERGPKLLQLALGTLGPLTKLARFFRKLLRTLPPHVATGRAIPNLDLGGFELGLTPVRFGFPAIAALENLGKKDTHGGAKILTDLRHRGAAVHGTTSKTQEGNPKEPDFTLTNKPCQRQLPHGLGCVHSRQCAMQSTKCLRLLDFGKSSFQCVADTRHLGVALVTAWAKVYVSVAVSSSGLVSYR